MSCRCLICILYWCWSESSVIFSSTFMQLVNGSKNSILNWDMKLDLFMFLFFFKPSNICYSIHLLFLLYLWFRCLQKREKESCMYLSSQFFLETSCKTLKLQEKSERVRESKSRKARKSVRNSFQGIWRPKFQKFSLWCPTWWHLPEIVN